MLRKFLPGWEFLKPLAAHCGVHAAFTFAIVVAMGKASLWWLAIVDFVIHFVMDRIKAGPKYLGRFKALSGNEYMEWARMGEVTYETDPTKIPIPSITPEMGKLRDAAFRSNVYFWWSLGIDQMVHHLTHYGIIYLMVTL